MSQNLILGNDAVLQLEVKATKETDNTLNEFSPRKWLEDTNKTLLSSSEFCPRFRFQFQKWQSRKEATRNISSCLLTEILSKSAVSEAGREVYRHRLDLGESYHRPELRWVLMAGSYKDWWLCRMFFQECLPTSLVTRNNQWPFNTATVFHPLEINPQSTVAMLIDAVMITTCLLRGFFFFPLLKQSLKRRSRTLKN